MNKSKKIKKSKIKTILDNLLSSNFFSEWRTPSDVIKKLTQRGFTIKGKKVGMVCQMLTRMCQDPTIGIERAEIPEERRLREEKWMFRKIKKRK